LPLAATIEREFTVTRGEVRYFGTPDLNAGLDIDARHQLRSLRGEPVTVLVHIGGTIEAPTLELSSDVRPPLSDTEVISYLLVGAPSVQAGSEGIAGRAVTQLAEQIAARLSGQLLSNTLISDLSLPLDYIEVRPELGPGGGAEIAVGRQVSERVFIALSPRICPQQEVLNYRNLGASLEFRMTNDLRISFSADPVSSCRLLGGPGSELQYQLGLDVLWETSY
jgi:translocation and assembly module TamB